MYVCVCVRVCVDGVDLDVCTRPRACVVCGGGGWKGDMWCYDHVQKSMLCANTHTHVRAGMSNRADEIGTAGAGEVHKGASVSGLASPAQCQHVLSTVAEVCECVGVCVCACVCARACITCFQLLQKLVCVLAWA